MEAAYVNEIGLSRQIWSLEVAFARPFQGVKGQVLYIESVHAAMRHDNPVRNRRIRQNLVPVVALLTQRWPKADSSRRHQFCSGVRFDNLLLHILGGELRISRITDRPADNDVVGAVLQGLLHRHHTLLIIARAILHWSNAGSNH